MAYQQKEGQGSLFTNEKKNDRQPDFKGTIVIKGVTYNLSAWNRVSQNGLQYISLQAEEKQMNAGYQYGQQPPRQAVPPINGQFFNQTQQYPEPPVYTEPIQTTPPSDMPSEEEDLPF